MRRHHHLLILIVAGVLLVLAALLVVGYVNGGDADNQEKQPTSGAPALARASR
jgi:hypothetical protein